MNLATSIGEVFIFSKVLILSKRFKKGGSSKASFTVDLDAKKLLKMSLLCFGSLIDWLFSTNGGVGENLLFFINLNKIWNFFFAGIELLFMVEFTE